MRFNMEIPKSKRLITLPNIYWTEIDKTKDDVLICSHNQALISVLNRVYPQLIQKLQQDKTQEQHPNDIKPSETKVISTPNESEPKVKEVPYTPYYKVCDCEHVEGRHEEDTGKCGVRGCLCKEFNFNADNTKLANNPVICECGHSELLHKGGKCKGNGGKCTCIEYRPLEKK
jgi:hypothetical protein